MILEGEHATDGQVDVTIGAGAASTTTIVGDLVVNGSTTTISTAQLTVEDDLITVSKQVETLTSHLLAHSPQATLFPVGSNNNKLVLQQRGGRAEIES